MSILFSTFVVEKETNKPPNTQDPEGHREHETDNNGSTEENKRVRPGQHRLELRRHRSNE